MFYHLQAPSFPNSCLGTRTYFAAADKKGVVWALTAVLFPLMAGVAAERPTPDQFDKLRALIKPHAYEDKWAEIPWTANLWEARQRAAALGKPILLWEMDGNPLGCG